MTSGETNLTAEGTGLDYLEARYMSAAQGRFTSPDRLGGQLEDPQTLNKYTYARNNPLAFTSTPVERSTGRTGEWRR